MEDYPRTLAELEARFSTQGAISHEHLNYYLDEYTFRFNRRTSRHRGKLFYRLLQQAVAVESSPYKAMTKQARGRKRKDHNM